MPAREPELGQVWEFCRPTRGNRTVKVIELEDQGGMRFAHIQNVTTGRKSVIRVDRMKPAYHWRLVR
jgi:hypothetical protein